MHGASSRSEARLGEHVRKALSPAEVAPKQKHVRACVMFAWDAQTSGPVWTALGMQPLLSDAVVCYKGLALVHRLLVGGPHVVLSEALPQRAYLDSCARAHGASPGYGALISAYVSFLQAKLEFHRLHPAFTGNFDYEEYVSVRGVANLDEGYETVNNLLAVLDRMARLQGAVLDAGGAASECRAAPLVPLVEESHGVFKFVTSMLDALVRVVPEPSVLLPLVERYCAHSRALRAFYATCARIPHLAALVDVPVLPREPDFVPAVQAASSPPPAAALVVRVPSPQVAVSPPRLIPKKESPLVDLLGDIEDDAPPGGHTHSAVAGREEVSTHVHTVTTVPVHDARLVAELQAAHARAAAAEEQVRVLSDACVAAQRHVAAYAERDGRLAAEAEELRERLAAAEARLASAGMSVHAAAEEQRSRADAATAEAAAWRAKFDGLSALYAGLRGEHLALLGRVESRQIPSPANQSAGSPAAPDDEMAAVFRAVAAAAERIAALQQQTAHGRAEDAAVVDGAAAIADAVSALVRAAIIAQRAVVAAGRESGLSAAEFYRANSAWTEGLVSSAKGVGAATAMLVDVADGALSGSHGPHHVAAAANAVSAATAQLLAASRVRALDLGAADVPGLEAAARAVTDSSRRLVDTSTTLMDAPADQSGAAVSGDAFGMRVEELERQARVLALERELAVARGDLAAVRRAAYEKPTVGDSLAASVMPGENEKPEETEKPDRAVTTNETTDQPTADPIEDVFSSLLAIGAGSTQTSLSPAQAPVRATDANPWRRDADDSDLLGDADLVSAGSSGQKTVSRSPAEAMPEGAPCPNEPSAQQ